MVSNDEDAPSPTQPPSRRALGKKLQALVYDIIAFLQLLPLLVVPQVTDLKKLSVNCCCSFAGAQIAVRL